MSGAVANRRKCQLDWIGGVYTLPVWLGRIIVKRHQYVAIFRLNLDLEKQNQLSNSLIQLIALETDL